MDRDRFDALARVCATAATRRQTLAALLGVGFFGAVGNVAAKQHGKAKRRRGKGKKQHRAARTEAVRCCSRGACTPGPGAYLAKCCYEDDSLSGQNFKGANLSGANFAGADLTNAVFAGANVSKACFVDADLTGATFTGARTSGAIFCRTQTSTGINNSGCGRGTACCPTCDGAHPCEAGEVCCDGRCVAGECCGSGEQSTCDAGQLCCQGVCETAECCANADCPGRAVCSDGRCCEVCTSGCPFTTVAAAIAAAAPKATIRICPGTYPTVNVTIDKDLTLIGAGTGDDPQASSILDAQQQSRVFTVAAGARVSLRRLTIANGKVIGRGVEGGGIHNSGTLVLDRAAIANCVTSSPDTSFGGGIFNQGVVTLQKTTIAKCSSDRGGAIYNDGTATLDGATITDNFTDGIQNFGSLTLKGATRISGNTDFAPFVGLGVFNRDSVVCMGAPRVCGNPDDATATADSNCFGVTDASCAGVCAGNATPGSGACPA